MSYITENPRDWVNLNWRKDHLLFHYGPERTTKLNVSKRKVMDLLQSNKYCMDLDHNNLEMGVTPCLLCGHAITDTDDESSGSYKCYHILPEYILSMLTGLPNQLYKQEYTKVIDTLKLLDPNKYEIIDREYKNFQREIWSLVYDWTHSLCSEIMRENPFMTINFRGDEIQIDHPESCVNNIKKLLGLLLFSKKSRKRTLKKKGRRQHKHISTPDKVLMWRKLILNDKSNVYKVKLALDQFNFISNKVHKLYMTLKNIDKHKLRIFSYLSIIVTLRIQINYVFNYGPIVWINKLQELFSTSSDKIKTMVDEERVKGGNSPMMIDAIEMKKDTYYSEKNLSDDVIYGGLLLLKTEQPQLFNLQDFDKVLIDMNILTLDDIINKIESDNLARFSNFCNFFRSYLNIDYPFRNQVDKKMAYFLFKQDVMNSINYVWNIWSSIFSVKEIIVRGEGKLADKLSGGPRLDEYASNYKNTIYYHKMLEMISYSLIDELESDEDYERDHEGDHELPMGSTEHLLEGSRPIKSETELQDNELQDKSLSNMIFMIGNKNVYSS